ncbi:DNA glycosylase AlkZ-like family protein [Ktedonobacter racemifer]|uniref:DNA glycosylase AlkZ-like family protein n=1 Tax=Ktedonobacter racemifer TaxID=363277 RepID=UPI000311384D|nr:crosslink repair DNA glycosylase YcaQ family protein [Ktedonobacter racemifer]
MDKQACLVPISNWPLRATIREMYRPYHDREILDLDPETPERILAAMDANGPLSSLEFEDRSPMSDANSWYGLTKKAKRALRSMWVCGLILTHHRRNGRHYYDRPERVIPDMHFQTPALLDREAYHRWIVGRRFQAVGLLRPNAESAIWSACGDAQTRKAAIAHLVAEGLLTHVKVGEKEWSYYLPTSALPLLESAASETLAEEMRLLAPLDSLLWDRKGVLQLFDFDYIWEVYKPAPQRRWGYYVLPIFYRDRFVARIDSRLEKGTWTIANWWWEQDIALDATLLAALTRASSRFLHYLHAQEIVVNETIDSPTRQALLAGARTALVE